MMEVTDKMAKAAADADLIPGYWGTMSAATAAATIARYRVIVEAALRAAPEQADKLTPR